MPRKVSLDFYTEIISASLFRGEGTTRDGSAPSYVDRIDGEKQSLAS